MSDHQFDHAPDWPGGNESTVRLSQSEIDDMAKEGHLAFLFSKIPVGYQERFRPYIFGNKLNNNQREVLAKDAVHARDSEELKEVEARAKEWIARESAAGRTLGEAATQTITGAPDTQAFLKNILSEEELVVPNAEIQLSDDAATTNQDTSASVAHHSQEGSQSPAHEIDEQLRPERPLFTDFKRLLQAELKRQHAVEDGSSEEPRYPRHSKDHNRIDFKPVNDTIYNLITRCTAGPYMGELAIPDQLAPHIYRALQPNDRHHIINFPHGFSPNRFLDAMGGRGFERPQASTEPKTFSNEHVQIPAAVISSVRIATLQEGRVTELPPSAQPQTPIELFEQCFNEALPAEAVKLLAGKEKYASNYSIRFHADELRIGALPDGSVGLELVIRQPKNKMHDVTMLAAALIGERKLVTVLANTVAIY